MRYLFIILVSSFALSLYGQQIAPDYSQKIARYKNASNYIVESYVSPDGDYSLILSPSKFYLWDGDGKLMTERDLMPKSKESVENEPRLFKTVEEGSGFMVMPEGEVVVLLDWGIGKGMVEVIDVKSGKSKWKSNEIGFANSAEDMAKKEGTKIAASILVRETGMNGGGEELIKKSQRPLFLSQDQTFTSKYVKNLITPLPDGNILMKTEGGQEAFDIATGEKIWEYKAFPMIVGGYAHTDDGKIVLINDNPSLYGENSSRNNIVMLDGKSGDELWQLDYAGSHDTEHMHIRDGLLILDKTLLSVVDLENGTLRLSTEIDGGKSVRSSKVGNFLASQNTPSPGQAQLSGLNSLQDGDHIYTGYIHSSGYNTVATGSLGTKTTIAKYDLNTGEQVWEIKGLADAIQEIAFTDASNVYVRRQAWGKQTIFALDKETGAINGELELDKGAIYWNDSHLVLAGKKALEFYNLSTLSSNKSIDYKETKYGEVVGLLALDNGFALVGESGMAWFDQSGAMSSEVIVADVDEWTRNGNNVILFGKKMTYIIDMTDRKLIGHIDHSFNSKKDVAVINAEGDKMLLIEDQYEISSYNLK